MLRFDKRGDAAGPWGLLRTARRLRSLRFDAAIAVQRSLRTAVLLAAAGIPLRVGFAGAPGAILYHRRIGGSGAHARDRLLSLLRGLGVDPPEPPPLPRLRVDPRAARSVGEMLAAGGVRAGDRLLVLAPGSAWATKRWPAARFGEVARLLSPECEAVAIVGGPADAALSAAAVEALGSGVDPRPVVVDLCGRTDTAGLVAAIARASLVVANDSAAGHVAGALGRPVVSIFGPTVPSFGFAPLGPRTRVVEHALECRPCARHGGDACPLRTHACMESIEAAEVATAGRTLLREERLHEPVGGDVPLGRRGAELA